MSTISENDEPKSRPMFDGDDWAELRDHQYTVQRDTMARVAGTVADMYQRAAVVMGREADPIARALRAERNFDLRCVMVAHAHLAAFWRYTRHHHDARLAGTTNLNTLMDEWQEWLFSEASLWIIDNPAIVHRFARVLALWQTSDAMVAEMELWELLKEYYAIPPPLNGDFFDNRATYTPYGV